MVTKQQPEHSTNALLSTALATTLAALVLLTLLGHNRLTDWDEGIYAQVSREMLRTGWLVPHWNSLVWIDKPPLTYWITALSFKLFGVSEFTARLGSALTAIALVTLLHAWLLRRRDNLTAWLSTLILLTTFGFLHVARVGETDTLLSLGCCLALIGLTNLLRPQSSPSTSGWYLYWTGFAIALMSKSAASGTLFITLLVLLALDPTLRRRLRAPFFLGFLLFLALVLPWHLYMFRLFGPIFVRQYLGLHVLGRVAYQFDGHLTPWWYYLRVLVFSAPPWVLLYPAALYAAFRRLPEANPNDPCILLDKAIASGAPSSATALSSPKVGLQDAHLPLAYLQLPNSTVRPLRPFAVFALVQILFFTCIQTRLPHYMAPAYAPLSALVAVWLANRLRALDIAHRPTAFRLQLATAAIAVWIIAALLTAHPRSRLHSPRLPNGNVTPNNHEEVALLKQVFAHPQPLVAAIPGPLLDWRPGTYNPIPTVLFYANRPVQQVQLQPLPPNTPTDIYAFNPEPLAQTVGTQPRLLLIDRTLIPQIPAAYAFQPLAQSPTLAVGLIALHP